MLKAAVRATWLTLGKIENAVDRRKVLQSGLQLRCSLAESVGSTLRRAEQPLVNKA